MAVSKARPWQHGSFWRFPLALGAFGALLPPAIYLLCNWPAAAQAFSRHSELLFFFCPPYVLAWTFEGMEARFRIGVVIFLMSPSNAVLYFLGGSFVAFFGGFGNKVLAKGDYGTEE
jgi:hypothetical protein